MRRSSLPWLTLAVIPLVAVSACTSGVTPTPPPTPPATAVETATPTPPSSPSPSPTPVQETATPAPTADADSPSRPQTGDPYTLGVPQSVIDEVDTLCADGPGKTVEMFDNEAIPSVYEPGTWVDAQTLGNVQVEPIQVFPVEIPETVARGGCVVRYEAPANCLPEVAFSPAWIPGVRVPGYEVVQPDGTVVSVPGVEIDARIVEGQVLPELCRAEGERAALGRNGMTRAGLERAGALRQGAWRAGLNQGSNQIEAVEIPSISIPAVSLPSQAVDAEELPSQP